MAYRETEAVRAKKNGIRNAILGAARARIAAGGYQAAQMQILAGDAGVATGTVYRYFDSKAELIAEVFRNVVRHEVDAVANAVHGKGTASERLAAVVETFMHRALRAPRLAYALLAEPVDPVVENERLVFRHSYAEVIRELLEDGITSGEFVPQDARIGAAALVGILNETLVGPLAPTADPDSPTNRITVTGDELVGAVTALCLRAVTSHKN